MDKQNFIREEKANGYSSAAAGDGRQQPRMSQYYRSPSSHHSSSSSGASSYRTLLPPHQYYYHQNPDFTPPILPPSAMWQHGGRRYKEDELPNMASNMAASMYPMQMPPNRRFSVASVASVTAMPPHLYNNSMVAMPQQRRRISVTKYQNIPPANFLQVPSFHDYEAHHQQEYEQPQLTTLDYVTYNNERQVEPKHSSSRSKNKSRRKSEGSLPDISNFRLQKPSSKDSSRSPSPTISETQLPNCDIQPSDDEISPEQTETIPAPTFEFNSSHLPLRPPTINVNKYSAGSGSTSTPESQRIESRQMIRSTSSKIHSPSNEVQKDNKNDKTLGNMKIWSITKPTKWCRHGDAKKCKDCHVKTGNKDEDAASQCSSVNPPPTFTAMDNYRPLKKRTKCSPCSISCGVVFRISVILAVIIMLFIAAFIVYVEMVLKHQTANVMDKM